MMLVLAHEAFRPSVACAGLTYVLRTLDGEKVHEQRDELYKIWTERLRTETKSQ